ncbi:MAG: hypothetical protein ACO3O3_09775 [Ilumatobacteraceae bacterium]
MEEVHINTIAYMEKPQSWAQIIATFADEELYAACAPAIEAWIAKQDPNYILTESCEHSINMEIDT